MITKEIADKVISLAYEVNSNVTFDDVDRNPLAGDVPDDAIKVFVVSSPHDYDYLLVVGYGIYDDGVWYTGDGECEITVYRWCEVQP